MFNQLNIDNRLRFPVRGRVIVFTTSQVVEFLDNDLSDTYPLFSVPEMPAGFGISFCVELDGYLTFDEGSQVKISAQLNPFSRIHYNPTAFAFVRPADPQLYNNTHLVRSEGQDVYVVTHSRAPAISGGGQ